MRRLRKKYKTPKRPWDSVRIEQEGKILKEYGLRRKKEIWRAESIVRDFRQRARNLIAVKNPEKTKILLDKLVQMGLIQEGHGLENVLALTSKDVLDRRLQTIIFRKGHSPTINNARQMIVHGHVFVGGRKSKVPSYVVPVEKEKTIRIKEIKK